MSPAVLSRRRLTAWPEGAVLVDRSSPWGNPHRAVPGLVSKQQAVDAFLPYAEAVLADDPSWLDPLRGADLVCHCLSPPCHAYHLRDLANRPRATNAVAEGPALLSRPLFPRSPALGRRATLGKT